MYFVVLHDGQKFGPADLNLLNQWVAEGRILHNTMLEDSRNGQRFPASSLPGLQIATATPPNSYPAPGTMNPPEPQQYAGYYRGGPMPGQPGVLPDTGQNDLTLAYVFAGIGLVMCLGGGFCGIGGIVFSVLGLVYAKKAQEKGHPGYMGAKVLSWIAIALQVAGFFLGAALFGLGLFSG